MKYHGRRCRGAIPETKLAILAGGGDESAEGIACKEWKHTVVPTQKPGRAKLVITDIDDIDLAPGNNPEPGSGSRVESGESGPLSGFIAFGT